MAGAAAAVVVLLNAGQVLRNVDTFGDPFGPEEPSLRVPTVSAGSTAGNLIRNSGHNLAMPAVSALNERTTSALRGVMSAVGIDPDDPSVLFAAERYDIDSSRNENRASSPAQWLLLLGAAVTALVSGRFRRRWGGLLLSLGAGYLLFSAVLKWQPWGARLLLPLLVVGAAPSAALLARLPRRLLAVAVVGLMAFSLPWLVASQYRPLVGSSSVLTSGPDDEYFRDRAPMREPYLDAVAYVSQLDVDRVGLVTGEDQWEYPFWALFDEAGHHVELVQVDVNNETSSRETVDRPSVVICVCNRPAPAGTEVRRFGLVQVETAASAR
jgi:hypothetical protein